MQEEGPTEILGECWLVSCCYKKSTISEMSQEGKLENTRGVLSLQLNSHSTQIPNKRTCNKSAMASQQQENALNTLNLLSAELGTSKLVTILDMYWKVIY